MIQAALIRVGVLAAAWFAFPPSADWLPALRDTETLSAVRLTAAEEREVLDQMERTSFDVPDSWAQEMRIRRVSLGAVEGLVVRGSSRLCGGTGNCQTWIFRRVGGRWRDAFASTAPIAASVGIGRASASTKDVFLTANTSADTESWTRYRFDGRHYRAVECYDVFDVGAGLGRPVPCR